MSRLFLISILACFSISPLFAQGTKGRVGSNTPQATLSPSSTVSKTAKSNPSTSQSIDRSTNAASTQNRPSTGSHTYGNTGTKQSVQNRSTRPSDIKTNRPATYAPPTNAPVAKGSGLGTAQKVAPLKAAERGTVNWMTLEQALEKSKTEKRKIFVDMYTDWCGWCKHMDSTTFVNPTVARYLNEHYYPVKFNAEQEQDIVFKDKTYRFKKNGSRGYHELAAFLAQQSIVFPNGGISG